MSKARFAPQRRVLAGVLPAAPEQLSLKISYSKEKQRGDGNLALPHYGCVSLDKFPNVSEHAS